MRSGLFVAVEGPEGAGKSTLAAALGERLGQTGADPLLVREPGGTPVAETIRRVLLDPQTPISPIAELYLFLAARADLVSRVIRPALEEGRVVIADRFQLSTVAYQIGGRGLPSDLVHEANAAATGGLEPDLTLVLDVSPRTGFARIHASGSGLDRMEREDEGFHRRVAETFHRAHGSGIVHVNAEQSPEQVLLQAWELVSHHVSAA